MPSSDKRALQIDAHSQIRLAVGYRPRAGECCHVLDLDVHRVEGNGTKERRRVLGQLDRAVPMACGGGTKKLVDTGRWPCELLSLSEVSGATISVLSTIVQCIRRTHNCASREPITLAPTVKHDLGKRASAQRFLVVPW
jgi:hypothetical protein